MINSLNDLPNETEQDQKDVTYVIGFILKDFLDCDACNQILTCKKREDFVDFWSRISLKSRQVRWQQITFLN